MNVDTFMQNFGHLADAPGGINKLREMVLQLAFAGKLTSPDSDDESALELVARVHAAKAQSVENNFNRKQKATPKIDSSLIPDVLPTGWESIALGEVAEIVRGVTFPGAAKGKHKEPNTVACLRTTNVQSEVEWDDLVFIPQEYVKREDQWVQPGDLLISMANSYELVGKVARVAAVETPACFGGFIGTIRTHEIDTAYLLRYLRSPSIQRAMRRSSSQTTNIANISLKGLQPIPVLLPPLAEQRRIVTKVNELMALCDELEARQQERRTVHVQLNNAALDRLTSAENDTEFKPAWTRVRNNFDLLYSIPENVNALRQSILQLAVMGKLVPQDPNDEPASRLLNQIAIQRKKSIERGQAKKRKPLASVSRDDFDHDFPTHWEVARLGDLLSCGPSNGVSPKPTDQPTATRSLTLSATTKGVFDPRHVKYLDQEYPKDSPLWLEEGDILIQRSNTEEYVGVSAIYHGPRHHFVYPDLMMKLRVVEALEVDFVHLAMSSEYSRDFWRQRSTGTSGSMKKINQGTVCSLPIPIPPIDEQRDIVDRVGKLMALCDELETKLSQQQTDADRLTEAMVAAILNETAA